MNLYVENDLKELEKKFVFSNELKDKTILVTGGTGLIGSLILRFLSLLNKERNLNMTVVGTARSKEKADALGMDITWIFCDLTDGISYSGTVDYIIHTASPTQSYFLANNPVEVIESTVSGASKLLRFAKDKNTQSVVYLSSMEVYGKNDSDAPLSEEKLGFIDNLNPRSSYSEGKRLIECLCSSYAHEYGVNVKIARLTQTFGCGIQKEDNRVFAQFVRAALEGTDIVLHTLGESSKNYVYTTDAIRAIFYILLKGKSAEAYNVANGESYISIMGMAELVRDEFNKNINIIVDLKDNMGYAPSTKVKLDTAKLENLGWTPFVPLKEMYKRTIAYYKSL